MKKIILVITVFFPFLAFSQMRVSMDNFCNATELTASLEAKIYGGPRKYISKKFSQLRSVDLTHITSSTFKDFIQNRKETLGLTDVDSEIKEMKRVLDFAASGIAQVSYAYDDGVGSNVWFFPILSIRVKDVVSNGKECVLGGAARILRD